MSINEENVSKILSVLSHPLRREILKDLSNKGECSFTDLMRAFNVDTGKLSFHIRSLAPFIEQSSTGRYKLNNTGEKAIKLINDLDSWAEEAEVSRKVFELSLAPFNKRVLAFLIDFLIMFAMIIIITFPSTFSIIILGSKFSLELSSIILFSTLALLWAYSTLLEGFKSQTLGKNVLGLKVIRIDGKKLSYDHSAVRNFGKTFLLPFDLIFGLRLKDERFLRYFDKFAGTTVINL